MAQQLIPALSEDEVRLIVGRMMRAGLLTDCFKNGDGSGWYIGFPTGHSERHASFELVAGVASVGNRAV
jgi:hypothetical protein